MKQYLNGVGLDVTADAIAHLRAATPIYQADLYLIGEPDDPMAIWLTNWESPLRWSLWGTFLSTVISRGNITCQLGTGSESLDITWSPRNTTLTNSMATASPYQLAQLGWFDNRRLRVWRTIMPTPGDADTLGARELFAGYIGDVEPGRGVIKLSVNDYRYPFNQKVPTAVIEVTNTLASYSGGRPPSGYSACPRFTVLAGSTETVLYADQLSPSAGSVPGTNSLNAGYAVFDGGSLQGMFSIIGRNLGWEDSGGHNHTEIQLTSSFSWAPEVGDTFYVSAAPALDQADGDYYGFPYVPAPETAV